jgi:hypothetical protein
LEVVELLHLQALVEVVQEIIQFLTLLLLMAVVGVVLFPVAVKEQVAMVALVAAALTKMPLGGQEHQDKEMLEVEEIFLLQEEMDVVAEAAVPEVQAHKE